MVRRFERILDLRAGELERGVLLFGYLFLVIGSFVIGKAVRDALFLNEFGALLLPYADIAVALLVGIWVSIYLRVSGRVSLRTLIVGSLLFFALNCVAFWVLSKTTHSTWLTPLIYVWVGMFGVVAPSQVWTLANYVLTTREAKRLYGFIGSGATAGWIVGGYVTQLAVRRFGAESTLIGMAVALSISAAIVDRLWRRRQLADEPPVEREERRTSVWNSLRMVASSPYLTAIAAVILLSSYTTAVAGWQFKALSSASVVGRDELAAFFGKFNFYAGLLSFALQWLVTGRLLRRLGLGFALFVVPVGLILGSLGLLTFQTLAAVVAMRGIDQVLRYSIDRPSVELLYLPVPAEQTNSVKSFIDTIVWRLGDGLAGLTILIATRWGRMAAVQLSWVNLGLLAGWIAAAWVAQRQYVKNLQDSIQHYRLDTERATSTGLERSATEMLSQQLSGDPTEVLYALRVLGAGGGHAMHPAVRGLLAHPSEEVRVEAIRVLDEAGDDAAHAAVEKLLYDTDLNVRTQALLYVAHHTQVDPLDRIEQLGDFQDFSIRAAMVTFLAQPGLHENLDAARLLLDRMLEDESPEAQLEAARLLELLPDQFDDQIQAVLASPSPEQVRLAIRAVGRLRKRKLIAKVIVRLGDPALVRDATEAVAAFGDRVVGTLRDDLMDPDTPVDVRREIPTVLLRIGSQVAAIALAENLLDIDPLVRFRVISALNKLQDLHPTWPIDVRLIETVLGAEIMGHLRSYQIVGTLDTALGGDSTPIAGTLRDAMDKELERIFRLMKMLHPHQDLHSAYVGVQSKNRVVHDNALEFLENILGPQMRALLVPLLDGDVPIGQRVGLANRVLGTSMTTQTEAVESLLASEDPWLRSCAAYAIGALRLDGFEDQLSRMARDTDPLLRETALQAQARLKEA